jgi:isochorismate synthase
VLVGDLLQALHPTPAVCGLPKQETFRFITAHEHVSRQYYSGFMGPLGIAHSTHLYVSLRCMQIHGNEHHLYAGGGLLKDSVEQQEWLETEAKMQTMKKILLN